MRYEDDELIPNPDAKWRISETTRERLRDDIAKAIKDGESNAQLANTIRDAYEFSDARAEIIARTETSIVENQASRIAWQESGVVESRQFLAAPGCCDECQAQDGEIVGLDEEFTEGDAPLDLTP
jgi:SPP1 gp7 family putative phage head morphogenesis protein